MERSKAMKQKQTPTFYIDVAPKLTCNGDGLPLDALSIFSMLSKFMGKYPEDWNKHFQGISQRNYNVVHFTPLMERGTSNSPYSLADQLKFDPAYFPNGEKDVAKLVKTMEEKYNLLALTDVVWNHTAHSSPWLEDHPEAGYNCETAPWLESAYDLDTAFLKFSSNLKTLGYTTNPQNVDELLPIMDGIKTHVIGNIKLWEFYIINVVKDAEAAVEDWKKGRVLFIEDVFGQDDGSVKQKADFLVKNGLKGQYPMGGRFSRTVDPKVSAALLTTLLGKYKGDTTSAKQALDMITKVLDEINLSFYGEYDRDTAEIMEQTFNRVKYVRIDDHGPKLGPIDDKNPLVESYFTRLPINARTKKHNPKSLAVVNNGWIWAADAMKDNAGPDSKAYLRREVIVWGDCVKLRYGKKPEDSPWLWDHMTKYTQLMAKYFNAFRVDNCHSTPIVVAEYLLDKAREVRKDIAIFAELFSGSEAMDWVFVKRLGLSALIREAMQAWSTQELSRLVHRHGGRPIGSFEVTEITKHDLDGNPLSEVIHKIKSSPLHALFMDCTHDNETPAQKRDARDTLPNAALVNMCASATGSVMGFDEIYPELIELVHEKRLYTSKSSEKEVKIGKGDGGIGGIKKLLNQIHVEMGKGGYDETFIHHEGELITVHRVHPLTRKGYFLIAHTAFPGYSDGNGGLSPVHLDGTKVKLIGAWNLTVDTSQATKQKILKNKTHLQGLPSQVHDLSGVQIEENSGNTIIKTPGYFPPGSIALFETSIPSAEHSDGLDAFCSSGADEAFNELSLTDLNFVLYRCEAEERDFSGGADGVYTIPDHGPLIYAGLQGWWSVLQHIVRDNNLGHPICNHLREGPWALDHVTGRLEKLVEREGFTSLEKPIAWLKARFDAVKKIPSFLLPRYFALIIQTAYAAAWKCGISLMSEDIQHGQLFLQQLAMVSIQQTGYCKTASLWPQKSVPCLAAGLPHFAVSWARCWGRDIFISMRGLFTGTGRFENAKEHILAFGSVVKHGNIPNLLGSGKNPRYNSRDSVWCFLQNIQDYTGVSPEGLGLLQEETPRRFLPYDDTFFEWDDPKAYSTKSTIADIIQEILQTHATGLSFREWNAGPNLDSQMKPEGFQIDIHVDWSNGIIYGGSQFNCGTWMDKMGESEKAGSKGVPGTPRDGAAIEITGMLYSTLVWLDKLYGAGKYSYPGVKVDDRKITWSEWAQLIKDNFEKCYYIPTDPKDDKNFDVDSKIVNRRGIYKDLHRSGKAYEDYQLRPNYPIAMTVAPDLFTQDRAFGALLVIDKYTRGPTGICTLDPSDLNYRPNYNNAEDSHDFATSKGRNYHQGPEWLWPTGFFLRALLKFDLARSTTKEEQTEALQQVTQRLYGCKQAIKESPWAGLTELTNKDGAFCGDSVSFFKSQHDHI